MTIVCGLVGANPQYSFSPRMHNAAFRHCGLDGRYELWPVPQNTGGAGESGGNCEAGGGPDGSAPGLDACSGPDACSGFGACPGSGAGSGPGLASGPGSDAGVAPGTGLEAFIRRFRAEGEEGRRGASVTIPYKEAVIPLLDGLTEQARSAGAVNTLFWKNGELWGDNTDSYGFLWPVRGRNFRKVLLLGSGGAARGVLAALAALAALPLLPPILPPILPAGAEGQTCPLRAPQIFISGRTLERSMALASAFPQLEARLEVLPWEERAAFFTRLAPQDEVLVVNATPLGMSGHFAGESPLPGDVWALAPRPAKITAYDLVYAPAERPFLKNAALAGCACVDGLFMLAAQAARQFAIWTGCELPPEYFVEFLAQKGS